MTERHRVLAFIGALSLAVAPLSEATAPIAPPSADRPHVLLITVDTLRADRVGAYGYELAETPNLDRLAREGVRADQAATTAPLTLPAHASILTGRYPFRHGVRDNVNFRLAEASSTLPEILLAEGYATGGFVGARVLGRHSGIAQGFQTFTDFNRLGARDPLGVGTEIERRADVVVDEALAWMNTRAGSFFAWVHLFDPHLPFTPPAPFSERHPGRPYDGEIAYTDHAIGRLLDGLASSGALANTVVVVTADHGEGLGDHGEQRHSLLAYDSTIRVPLVFWGPGRFEPGAVLAEQASVVDILPTLLAVLGIGDPMAGTRDGLDVRGLFDAGESPRREVYAEGMVALLELGWSELRVLRSTSLKLISGPRQELYDVAADPGETIDLADRHPSDTERLQRRLEEMIEGDDVADLALGERLAGGLTEQEIRSLQSLGYIGTAIAPTARSRTDPGLHIATAEAFQDLVRNVSSAMAAENWEGSEAAIEALHRLVPGHPLVDSFRGRLSLKSGDPEAAITELERSLRRAPANTLTWLDLAAALRAAGHRQRAYEVLHDGAAAFPDIGNFHYRRGAFLREDGDRQEALAAFDAALAIAPTDPALLRSVASLHLETGEYRAARGALMQLVRVTPTSSDAWTGLATAFCRLDEWAACEAALRQAVATAPDGARPLFDLGRFLADRGRADEAIAALRGAAALDSSHPGIQQLLRRLDQR